MTTPAGWYDDGSGRQRWWDGQQWTEHFAPETSASVESEAASAPEPEAAPEAVSEAELPSDESSLDDTVVRPSTETVISPDNGSNWSVPEAQTEAQPETTQADAAQPEATPYEAPGDVAAYAPPAGPSYGAPASPAYNAPAYGAPAAPSYPGAAPGQPSAGYPAAAPYGAPEGPKKISVLGLVGLGLSGLGTILAFIPVVGFIGFILLAAGFIVSLISLFLKGKKWPGIAGLILAVVGTIIGVVMFFVYIGLAIAQGVSDEIDSPSSSYSSTPAPEESEGTDAGTDTGARPTADEVAVGLAAIFAATEVEGYTETQILCLADQFVTSDLDNATLRAIADSDGTFTDPDVAYGVAEVLSDTDALTGCLVP